MRSEQNLAFSGHLNTDTAPEKMSSEDYVDAKNILPLTNNTESTGNHIPMLGNVAAFDIGSIAVQNKTYRLYTEDMSLSTPEPSAATLLFYMNGIQFGGTVPFWLTYYTVSWSRNWPVPKQATSIQAAINVWDTGATVTPGSGYVDITLSTVPGGDYTISATTGAATPAAMTHAIVAEAFSADMVGELKPIGSYDLLGDLYVWSASSGNLPSTSTLTITSVSLAVAGLVTSYMVTFSSAHGLSVGESIDFVGNNSSPLDGSWIVSQYGFTSTTIILDDYYIKVLPATLPTSATITRYSKAVGEIGIAQYSPPSAAWAYTRIGRTKQWGFRLQKQCDTYCEQNTIKSSVYWTDNFNVPRCIYYVKEYSANNVLQPFEQDGIITAINSTGLYTYETINTESSLQQNTAGARISFVQQLQAGGGLLSGNWRYSARFLSDNLVSTECLDLTNPINVCSANLTGNPALIIGDAPETVTNKINQILVSGITPGLFKYVELIGVNYVGDAVVGYKIKRVELKGTDVSVIINHTGLETDTTDFDLGLLSQLFVDIRTARSIDVIDKRMILSNITTRQRTDFRGWAETFTHRLLRQPIDSVRGAVQGTLRAAEYMTPTNVYNYLGYMQNETYRFGVKVKLMGGGWTEVFHIDDICFTTFATNLNASGVAVSSDPTRRISGLSSLSLTDSTGVTTTAYVPYVRFENINLDYKIDGVPIRNLIEDISIERVECVPEILCAGVGVLSVYGSANVDAANANAWVVSSFYPATNPYGGTPNSIIEYPFVSGRDGIAGAPNNPQYPNNTGTFGDNMQPNRRFMALYSPDVWFGHTSLSLGASDLIINHGQPSGPTVTNTNSGGTLPSSGFGQYTGDTGVNNSMVQLITPTNTVYLAKAESTTIGGISFTKNNPVSDTTGAGANGYAPSASGYLITAASDFSKPSSYNDYGLRYVQYYKPLMNKYGDAEDSVYISCGAMTEVSSSSSTIITMDVFGGDTFTQLSYFKHRYVTTLQNGLAGAMSFYSQNRVNAQMKQKSVSQTGNLYPGISLLSWLETPTDTDSTQGESYQEGYTARNEVKSDVAYDPSVTTATSQPARIRWSPVKPQDATGDPYRTYLYLDYHDLDQSNGEIVHHRNGNGELLTWQQRAFMRQFFNARGTLEVKGISEVLIGDGSVMSRDGVTISRYGSKHKWAICKGRSSGGNDVFYWINTELKKVLRFGYDGTVSLSDIKGMQSFFANNLTWVDGYDTPVYNYGISAVWDDRYANVIWSVNGQNPSVTINNWSASTAVVPGDLVFYPTDPFLGKQFTYRSLVTAATTTAPDTTPSQWVLVANDGTYFNKYSIVLNEFKNAFISFTTAIPKIYLKWTDTYLSPRPISPESKVYQHNRGRYLWWYENAGVQQTERGYVEGVVNAIPTETKLYEAVGIDSDITPIRQEFSTKTQESFLIQSEFRTRDGSSFSPIKRDSTSNGINSGNTAPLAGKWMKIKTFFEIDLYQQLSNITVKFRLSPRYKNK